MGAGLESDQDDLAARRRPRDGRHGVEHGLADGRSGAGSETATEHLDAGGRGELGMEQGLKLGTVHATQRLVEVDAALVDEVHRDAEGGGGAALADTNLEYPEAPVLDGELDVAHVPEAVLQRFRMVLQLVVCVRQKRL
jgi:hypothetical protein